MAVSKTSKMVAFVNYRVRVTIVDGREIVGRFMAFDRHVNLVLADAEEHRKLPATRTMDADDRHVRRVLGFVLLRGEEVVSLTVEGQPPAGTGRTATRSGTGRAAGAGRGMPAPTAAAAPTRFGGPPLGAMMPGGGPPPGMRPPGR